jgi:hypothetical protein
MNRENIMKWAKESGAMFDHITWVERDLLPVFERFAELVRQEEREACIKLLEDFSKTGMVPVKDTWRMGLIAGANAIRGRTE